MLIQACLNGNRKPEEHPALPLSPEELARDARLSLDAGAGALHVHPRRADGAETLAAREVGDAVAAIRAVCPGTPVGVATGAWISPDLPQKLALLGSWRMLDEERRPDFASVNFSEKGAEEVCATLLGAGIGVEAGLWSTEDARLFVESGMAGRCVRVLIELVRERTAEEATATAREIERTLDETGVTEPRLLHGERDVAWPMLRYALKRGFDVRIGLEDTLVMPDGSSSQGNVQLVGAVVDLSKREMRP